MRNDKGQFVKGTGGRPKGASNRTTKELREAVSSFLDDNWGEVQTCFDKLEAKDKLAFIEKMLSYTLPKVQSVELDTKQQAQNITITRKIIG